MKWGLLFFFPLIASAQPPGYTCTHWNDYYQQGTPGPGQPNECEAVGNASQGSFTYFFPVTGNADPPVQAVPEVSPEGVASALTLLAGLCLAVSARRGPKHPSRDDRSVLESKG